MKTSIHNKRKIFNDPIYGFITIPSEIVYDLIEHPYFQRLRRIKQLGLTHLVYPGAYHSRFHHALGAMHLMMNAIDVLKNKGNEITDEEAEGVIIAILLHDIGHGPFSHALETSITNNVHHEEISLMFMEALNDEFGGKLQTAIDIFSGKYHKKFLHQLVSSQLDMDRLDYLKRDSFYTGVSEGVIGTERIIKMLNVRNDYLCLEEKGIYSIENFLNARRIMYWQVYLHKTVLSAEFLLVKILEKAKQLIQSGEVLFGTPTFIEFLKNDYSLDDFKSNPSLLKKFSQLDDFDILTSTKVWCEHPNASLSQLCLQLINRKLYKIKVQDQPFEEDYVSLLKDKCVNQLGIPVEDLDYFVFSENIKTRIYDPENNSINLLMKDGQTIDISKVSDQLKGHQFTPENKYFICYPKNLS